MPPDPPFNPSTSAVFLESGLNTALHEGPISTKLADPVSLSDGSVLPKDTVLTGYYVTRGNKVLFAPSFATIGSEDGERTIAINSMQTGQVAVTPSTARYLKETGKGAAIGAGVGAVGGAIAGGVEHGWVGALVGAAVGAGVGAATGAAGSALGVWLRGDEPTSLPAGSGLIIHIES